MALLDKGKSSILVSSAILFSLLFSLFFSDLGFATDCLLISSAIQAKCCAKIFDASCKASPGLIVPSVSTVIIKRL